MEDQAYTLSILKMVINTDLEKKLAESISELELFESKRDQLVWEMATKIYTRSGHKVELTMVRDLIDEHIKNRKSQLSKQSRIHEYVPHTVPEKTKPASPINSARWVFLKTCSVICKCTELGANRVSMASRIDEIADEREFIKILRDLEVAFDIKLPAKAPSNIQTVKHLVDFISHKMKAHHNLGTSIAV